MSAGGGPSGGDAAGGPLVILAAGGLLWRLDAGRPELAVVHRHRHRDWSLPKGKLDPGESPEQAALREVEEETGFHPRALAYAGHLEYTVRGTPKVVFFWHMAAESGAFAPNDEVDELEWLAPEAAAQRLSYGGERRLVARASAPPAAAG